jgi:hypothetical protein
MLSRRSFIKTAAFSAAILAAKTSHYTPVFARQTTANTLATRLMDAAPASLGRVTVSSLPIHTAPDSASASSQNFLRDEVFSILRQITNNKTGWYLTERGYVNAAYAQPVENQPNQTLAKAGQLGEICVPFTDARKQISANAPIFYRLYYASVFRIAGVVNDETGSAWYLLADGLRSGAYIPAAHLRPILPDELTPLAPEVKNKRIEVNTATNIIRAYEDDKIVLETRVATGKLTDYTFTPAGSFSIFSKKPASHMIGLWGRPEFYDLPGVPFASFFTARGAAIHGAYWHNDFGSNRSHGCINVPPAIARWFWRWVTPAAPYQASLYYGGPGTPVVVSKS